MTPASTTHELDPFNPTNDDPVSPVYPIRRQLRKPSFEGGPPPARGRQLGYEPPYEGLFAMGTGNLIQEDGHRPSEQDEAKRAKNQYYRSKSMERGGRRGDERKR